MATQNVTDLYKTRFSNDKDDHAMLSNLFMSHMIAMTTENLRSKGEIAWELAARDLEIYRLNMLIKGRDIDGKLIPAQPFLQSN